MKNDNTPVDIDFAEAAVPHYARRGIVTMFMIMLGFTFFSASMWVGKELADRLVRRRYRHVCHSGCK